MIGQFLILIKLYILDLLWIEINYLKHILTKEKVNILRNIQNIGNWDNALLSLIDISR